MSDNTNNTGEIVQNNTFVQPENCKDSVPEKRKGWIFNFIMLWQGSFVSHIGTTVYSVAMSFYLLQKIGSTAIMGSIGAVTLIVHSIVSLFSGAVVDKVNKRNVMVLTDFFQGVLYTALGAAALFNILELWMIVVIGVLAGVCSAFFFPASGSMVPELVPPASLTRANAFMMMILLGAPIIGNGAGGFLFQTLGAPLLFIGNGISYFISSFSELFIKMPKQKAAGEKSDLIRDIKEGYRYMGRKKGLLFFLVLNMVMNIFAFAGLFLVLPFFERTPGLGPAAFGIVMAVLSVGGLVGMVFSTFFTIKPNQRILVYTFSIIGMTFLAASLPWLPAMTTLCILSFFAGLFRAYFFLIYSVVVQSNVDRHMLGRVNGLQGIMIHSATPLGMVLGGVLAEFFSLHILITGSFVISGLAIIPLLFYKPTREMFKNELKEEDD